MQWNTNSEKQLGVELGFVVRGQTSARSFRLINLIFDEKDSERNNPREGNVRPASNAEVKMWRALLRNL